MISSYLCHKLNLIQTIHSILWDLIVLVRAQYQYAFDIFSDIAYGNMYFLLYRLQHLSSPKLLSLQFLDCKTCPHKNFNQCDHFDKDVCDTFLSIFDTYNFFTIVCNQLENLKHRIPLDVVFGL